MTNQNYPWQDQLQVLQKQMSDFWSQATQKNTMDSMSSGMMKDGYEAWAKIFQTQNGAEDLTERMLGGTKQWMALMQSALQTQGAAVDPGHFATMGSGLVEQLKKMASSMGALPNQWQTLKDNAGHGFEKMFADFAQTKASFMPGIESLASMPAFGQNREQIERAQNLSAAWNEYSKSLRVHNGLMFKASQQGISRFESKLGERSEPGREIKSLRELYDLYIDAAEEAYAEMALSPEFRQSYGALVNTQMKVRQLTQDEIERLTGSMGMPTRTEVNAVHAKLADIRRRLAYLEDSVVVPKEDVHENSTPAKSDSVKKTPKAKEQKKQKSRKKMVIKMAQAKQKTVKQSGKSNTGGVAIKKGATFAERLAVSRAQNKAASSRSKGVR